MQPTLRGLYVITDPQLTPPHSLLAQVEAALRGGARIVQLRDKSADAALRLQMARQLRGLTQRHGALLIINDDARLCLESGADGVHLGQDDLSLAQARSLLGPAAIIGITCHGSLALAEQALAGGADYLAFGRFFPSQTKPDAPLATLADVATFIRRCPVPAVAIGGITLNNAAPLLETGFAMLAVVNDVFAHQDIEGQCRRFSRLFAATFSPQPFSPYQASALKGTPMTRSEILFAKAQIHIPGGVNSPVRAFKGVGGSPVFFKSGRGAWLTDEDGRQYIDYVGSWGPMILGHAHPDIVRAVQAAAERGLSFGAPTAIEVEMADKVCEIFPHMDSVRMVSSGTEATMSAIRLARGFTGRDKIVKFEGCYHGHADSLLVKAGSGALTLGVPNSPGVPAALAEHTLTLEYNNAGQVRELFQQMGDQIACIIVEPVAGNMNCIPPEPGFLECLRDVCDASGAMLIFDEVMTGFRVSLQGAQGHYKIRPDLTTLGKVIGGGMPVGAFGGRKDIMDHIAPIGPVYQAGTLSGNPVAMAAGMAMLKAVMAPGFYEALTKKTDTLMAGFRAAAKEAGIPLTTNQVGGMFGYFFSDETTISRYSQVTKCNIGRFQRFYHLMLKEGVYLAPSAYEAGFVSMAHGKAELDETLTAVRKVMKQL